MDDFGVPLSGNLQVNILKSELMTLRSKKNMVFGPIARRLRYRFPSLDATVTSFSLKMAHGQFHPINGTINYLKSYWSYPIDHEPIDWVNSWLIFQVMNWAYPSPHHPFSMAFPEASRSLPRRARPSTGAPTADKVARTMVAKDWRWKITRGLRGTIYIYVYIYIYLRGTIYLYIYI